MKQRFFNNKICMLLFPLAAIALFCYAVYSYYYVYLRWEKMAEVGIYSAATILLIALMAWFAVEADTKKPRSGKSKLLRVLAALITAAAVFFGVAYLINNVWGNEGEAKLAICVTLSLIMLMFAAVCVIFFANRSKSGMKALNRLLSAAIAVSMVCASANLLAGFFTYHWTYPVYRVFSDMGGEATDNPSIVCDFAYSTQKPLPTDNLSNNGKTEISLAKNEWEGLQLILAATDKGCEVTVEVTDFVNASGDSLPVTVYKEMYSAVPEFGSTFSYDYADALVPENTAQLEKNKAQAFYIETRTEPESAAGDYTATLTVKDKSDTVILTRAISAKVWDFTLPETPSSQTAMGLASNNFWVLNGFEASGYGWNGTGGGDITEQQRDMYLSYYNYLLERKISPYVLPYDILDDRADAYMSDARVTSFCMPYPKDDAKLVEYYTKVSSNPDWAAKAYFYPIDEPNDEQAYTTYTEMTDRLSRLCPGYNMVTPFCTESVTVGGVQSDAIELQSGRSSILCAISNIYDSEGFHEKMAAEVEKGSRSWWYVCCGPQGDYNNFFIRQDAIQHRLLMWQQKKLDITGLLYWNTTFWDKANPWESSKTWDSYEAAGDGCLLYPGKPAGVDGPVGTLRVANITDGLEDYDYLTLAEEKFGREWVDEKIERVVTSLTEYTGDDELLESVRAEIGEALSAK